MTRREIEDAIAAERARIARAEARLVLLSKLLDLHSEEEGSRMHSNMQLDNAETKKKGTKISARLTRNDTEARALLLAADRTPADIAAELEVARSTVQAWIDGRNGIPKSARDYLRANYGIPDSAWPKAQD